MANPALIAKAIAIALSDNRIRKSIGWVIAAIFSPIILIVLILFAMLSGAAGNNTSVLELCFYGGSISESYPEQHRVNIESMRSSFSALGSILSDMSESLDNGMSIDSKRIRSIFYALYFGNAEAESKATKQYVDCFVTYEERITTVLNEEGTTTERSSMVAVPITDLSIIYQNINATLGTTVSYKQMRNATEIYYRIAYGTSAPSEADSSIGWESWSYQPTTEEFANLNHSLPEGELGSEIVLKAISRLGAPYSQALRGQGDYVDCSYLTKWCYAQLGIAIPGTAAEQGRYCYNQGLTIAREDLRPGDLVFWSYEPNGRFMNITHVGIYAGDDMVIDASSTKGMVVYRNIYHTNKQVLYGRPHIEP